MHFFACKRAFEKLRDACELHEEVLEDEELEKYKKLKGWRSDADWDKELKKREIQVNLENWVGGLPSPIRKQLHLIRKWQEIWLTSPVRKRQRNYEKIRCYL